MSATRDDAHRAPQMLHRLGFAAVGIVGHQELGGDVEQRQAAGDFQIRQQHQRGDDAGEENAQQHGDAGAENHAPDALAGRQAAAGERDDHGVVAGKQNVDPDDARDRDPELGTAGVAPAAAEHRGPGGRIG